MDAFELLVSVWSTDAVLLKLLLGSIFGLCLGLTGVGGGVLLIPMLQLFCGMSPVLAVGTASMISAMVKVNASFLHIRARNVSWKKIILLFIGAVPVTLLVTQVVVYFNAHPFYSEATETTIAWLVTIVMIGSLISVFSKYKSENVAISHHSEHKLNTKKAIVSGMFCGSILGSTGVGGGVLLLPILNSVLHVDIKKAIGSSVVLALFLSAIAAVGYASGGQSDIDTAILFFVGSFVGVPVAAHLMKHMSESHIYVVTMLVISVSLFSYIIL
ncbi:sulfite exporter TauE/SafE family protein [Photobacterium sp. DNB23_23_1]|uniref:Probable membrane transporter protein n=1 Tax=Photobacterium pectinilyticum TaxID=2906793 RepID=A0ABT1N5B0_9GAMM|nr:sulfite exporter TauE/SafE family protein [Photobacterium sp. ZSDE20]MCQ1059905.1 sulfite exporter TauE/SafE family protein [Photobacterium sp. ZSDE20]MDD1826094.1 sulfite exporter TauE/SafE family protein [Photobacterium sp. ZSDE20]